jgi:hypothetical protein
MWQQQQHWAVAVRSRRILGWVSPGAAAYGQRGMHRSLHLPQLLLQQRRQLEVLLLMRHSS